MKNELHTYRKETVRHRRFLPYCLKICLIVLLVLSCKKNSSGPEIDTEDLLPSALILSPPKVAIADSQDAPEAKRKAILQSDASHYDEVTYPPRPHSDYDSGETEMEVSGKTTTDMPDANTYVKGTPVLFEGIGVNFQGDTLDGTSLKWISDVDGELGTGNLLEKTDLDTGRHWIFMIVTDHNRLESRDSVRIEIVDAKDLVDEPDGLTAEITSLTDGISLLQHTKLILEGTGFDAEDGELTGSSLSWSSNKNGDLGKGNELDVTGNLSSGGHTIMLTATNSKGETATDSVIISIEHESNQLPVAEILSLAQGSTLLEGAKLVLEGAGLDPEDGELTGTALSWESDVDGELGTGRVLDVTEMLSLGDHLITLTVTDSEGATDSDSIDISIKADEVINAPPVAEILSVAGISSFTERITVLNDVNLILKGTGIDPEDGKLDGTSLEWKSDIDGYLGTGEEFNASESLSTPGNHTITLTVTDQDEATDKVSVDIRLHKLPEVKINSPVDDEVLSLLDEVILHLDGFAEDVYGQALLSENHLEWSASLNDGEPFYLGAGSELQRLVEEILEAGEYTITLTATDDKGYENSDSVNIRINEPPEAKIISVTDESTLSEAKLILEGTGTDLEDEELDTDKFVWSTSSEDGDRIELGTGESLTITDELLSLGEYTITLTVKDSDEATGIDTEDIELKLLD